MHVQAKVAKAAAQQAAKHADAATLEPPGDTANAVDSSAQQMLVPEAQADAPPGEVDIGKDTDMRDDTAMADADTGTSVATAAAVNNASVRCYPGTSEYLRA
jgi:hypothetical protein